jgi:hypothetical protein
MLKTLLELIRAGAGRCSAPLELIRAGADRRSALLVASIAGVLFLASWATIHHGFYSEHKIVDTPLYQHYGDWVMEGNVPYRDFSLEYPPGALPAFILPAIGNSTSAEPSTATIGPYRVRAAYRRNFELLMELCGLASISLLAIGLLRLGASNGRMALSLGLAGLSPLLLGPMLLSRFDLWPTAFALAALVAMLDDRHWIGFGLLGAATAAKIFPVVLLPIGIVWVWKRTGKRELAACLEIYLAVLFACFVPFAIAAPHGLVHSFAVQLNRPLQIESLGAAVLVGLHHVVGLAASVENGSGSQNLAASGSEVVAWVQTGLQVAALLGAWIWFARGDASRERLVRASAAALVAFVAFGKVLSPQYLIWLCPFILLVLGRRGLATSALLALSLVLTQLWFPYRYWDYALHFGSLPSALVLTRDLALLGIFALILAGPRRREQELPAEAPVQAALIQSGA